MPNPLLRLSHFTDDPIEGRLYHLHQQFFNESFLAKYFYKGITDIYFIS